MPACPRCGEHNPDRARFCLACGLPLEATGVPSRREVRKTVTVVFTDVTGSTALGERLDPESLRRVMSRYFDEMRTVLERHGGTVEKFIGDAIVAVFGIPVLHEDDALRAIRAAAEMRDALESLNEELEREWGVRIQVRTGVNTGEVVAGDPALGQSMVVGDAVNVAARLEQTAPPDSIQIGATTYRLVRDAVEVESLEPLALKGKAQAVPAYRLLHVRPGAPAFERRMDSPMVGRDREQLLLNQTFERTAEERSCHLFTVLGAAGVGKSRLAAELVSMCRMRARVHGGRCLPYGEGITFWPIVEVVREAAEITDEDSAQQGRTKIDALLEGQEDADLVAERVAQVVGLADVTTEAEEITWAVRRLFEALAETEPLVVVLDDIHWAEPTLLDLIEHVADWSRDAPILLVCLARAELLDIRPTWGGGKLNATSIHLEPLTEEQSSTLIGNLLGRAELSEDAGRRIAEAAEGNPLFVEEMLSMLIDDGLLLRDDGHWVPASDLSGVSVPPTIQALLAARLDRLGPDERVVIERASVEGKVFHRGAVAELSPASERDAVAGHLQTLVRKELVRPNRPDFAGEDAFAFRHLLIRDAAYEGMPKETRADLHGRFATWLERSAGSRLAEYEEIIGYQLEQAHRYRTELGPVDERTTDLGRRAAEHLGRAGRRAFDRGDAPGATNLLQRALALLPEEDPARLGHSVDLGKALAVQGEFVRAEELLEGTVEAASTLGDQTMEWRARMERLDIRIMADPGGTTMEESRTGAEHAIGLFTELGDESGLARAWHVLAMVHWNEAGSRKTQEALEEAILHARKAGDHRQEAEDLAWLLITAGWGSRPIAEALTMIHGILGRSRQHPKVEAFASISRGFLESMTGDFDHAREMVRRGRDSLQDLGFAVDAAATCHASGHVELMAGDPAAAERELRAGYDALERMGEKAYLSTTAARLAEAVYAQGRYDEAERYSRISEEAADPGDLESQMRWRAARAMALARGGQVEDAERLARDAVTLAEGTDFTDTHADMLRSLAEVLRLAGRREEAMSAEQRALAFYEAKGNVMQAEQTRALLERISAS
jgi:class 3 adenylate cyclase/tetratricopeptide (TPR) repeat protein